MPIQNLWERDMAFNVMLPVPTADEPTVGVVGKSLAICFLAAPIAVI